MGDRGSDAMGDSDHEPDATVLADRDEVEDMDDQAFEDDIAEGGGQSGTAAGRRHLGRDLSHYLSANQSSSSEGAVASGAPAIAPRTVAPTDHVAGVVPGPTQSTVRPSIPAAQQSGQYGASPGGGFPGSYGGYFHGYASGQRYGGVRAGYQPQPRPTPYYGPGQGMTSPGGYGAPPPMQWPMAVPAPAPAPIQYSSMATTQAVPTPTPPIVTPAVTTPSGQGVQGGQGMQQLGSQQQGHGGGGRAPLPSSASSVSQPTVLSSGHGPHHPNQPVVPTTQAAPVTQVAPTAPGTVDSYAQVPPNSRGVSTAMWNALKMIAYFHSDCSSPEKAKAFWDSFKRNTAGLDDATRLLAFQQRLKGKAAESWWNNSRIRDFPTLDVRFHNRFISLSPEQLIERLKNAKRSKGESVEEWSDRIQDMCDSMSYYDEHMRYQYFLEGLCNRRIRALLDTSQAETIDEALALILRKSLHMPVEEDDAFGRSPRKVKEEDGGGADAKIEALAQQVQLLVQLQQKQLTASPTLEPSRPQPGVRYVSMVPPGNGEGVYAAVDQPEVQQRGIRQGPDTFTHEGVVVCGRCLRLGCSRLTCSRQFGVCHRCRQNGHFAVECSLPATPRSPGGNADYGNRGGFNDNRGGYGGNGVGYVGYGGYDNRGPPPGPPKCFLCDEPNHRMAQCPWRNRLLELKNASKTAEKATSQQ